MNCVFYLTYILSIYLRDAWFEQFKVVKSEERIHYIKEGYVSFSPRIRKLMKNKIDKENERELLQEAQELLKILQASER